MLRFYVDDGWTKGGLEYYLKSGSVSIKHEHDISQYFTLDEHSFFDCEKLHADGHSLVRAFDDYPYQSDVEFMKSKQY